MNLTKITICALLAVAISACSKEEDIK